MNGTSTIVSSEYRPRLLPTLIDELSVSEPARVFVSYPLSSHPRDGYRDVTYREFAAAINRCAWWIEKDLGRSEDFKTLTYIGPQDLRSIILLYSSIKTGYKLFLSSLSNNKLEDHLKLVEDLQCSIMLTPAEKPPIAESILSSRTMRQLTVPTLDELLIAEEVPIYPYSKTYSQARNEPFVVLNSSGSTGLPKPIVVNHGTITHHDLFLRAPSLGGRPLNLCHFSGRRVFIGLPIFHSAGLCFLAFSIYLNITPVLPSWPLSAETVNQALLHAGVDSGFVIPSILADIVRNPEYVENIKCLRYLTFGGSPLPREIGNKVKDLTHLFVSFGATETGYYALEQTVREDWEYASFSPIMGFELRPFSEGLYEFVFVRDDSPTKSQGAFSTFPTIEEYSAKDLFSPHPTKQGLWLYEGRADDVIVFPNGKKMKPSTMESALSAHSAVNSAIVCLEGEGRFYAVLLVEPTQPPHTTAERAQLLEDLWPLIEKSNEASPPHGRISKAHVLFTKPGKPMLRAGKGSVQRRLTLNAYADEISALYTDAESLMNVQLPPPFHEMGTSSLESLILRLVQRLALHDKQIGLDDDFFSHEGIDSVQVLQLIRQLGIHGYSTKDKFDTLSPSIVYNNPTARKLAVAIQSLMAESQDRIALSSSARMQEMQNVLFEFSGPRGEKRSGRSDIVMLTGSTGALGSYLLASLMKTPKVKKIYCLNRAGSAERQAEINALRGLSTDFDKSRIRFFEANLTAPFFGLDESIYEEISTTVTRIIHCAWPVDFNQSLQSFIPQLEGVRALIYFAASPKQPKSIFLISSIASVGSWSAPEPVPEVPLLDFSLPLATGYAESKFVAEQLLLGSASLVDVSICRVGQIAGPALSDKGIWKRDEWLPSLIRSSKHLKLLPESLTSSMTEVSWMPVDLLSTALVELTLLPRKESTRIYHAVNPRSCSWKSLLPAVRHLLGALDVKIVPFGEWVEALRKSAAETFEKQNFEENPAVKLLDFYEGLPRTKMPRLSTVETQKRSKVLREMRAIEPEDMKRWMRQWGFVEQKPSNAVTS